MMRKLLFGLFTLIGFGLMLFIALVLMPALAPQGGDIVYPLFALQLATFGFTAFSFYHLIGD